MSTTRLRAAARRTLSIGLALCSIAASGWVHVAAAKPATHATHDHAVGFRSAELLDRHYRKHGREFGRISRTEYLARARALRDATTGVVVLQIVRTDGVITRFDRRTGAFIAFERDGTIRTFFKPREGETYFRRQARRSR